MTLNWRHRGWVPSSGTVVRLLVKIIFLTFFRQIFCFSIGNSHLGYRFCRNLSLYYKGLMNIIKLRHCQPILLSSAAPLINLGNIEWNNSSVMLRVEPRAAGWGAQTLPLCFDVPLVGPFFSFPAQLGKSFCVCSWYEVRFLNFFLSLDTDTNQMMLSWNVLMTLFLIKFSRKSPC